MLGGHLLAASATTQNVEATSSGEAEFYALIKSAPRALGAVAMAADMAKVVKPRVRVDATASKAIALRRGVERVRHLHTQVLWMQEAVARRELTIAKVQGVENPADMGTKHLAQREMHECLLPYHRRTVEDDAWGRTGDLSERPCGYGNDRSRTSIEIDDMLSTSRMIYFATNRQLEFKSTSRCNELES